MKLEQAARQALAAFEYMEYDGKCVTALREALAEQAVVKKSLTAQEQESVAEWEKLKDPQTLFVNLNRGFPAKLTHGHLLHLLNKTEQAEQEPIRLQCTTCGTVYANGVPPQVKQAEQEPVAWMRLNEKGECEAIEYIGNVDEHLYLPPSCQWLYISSVITMQQEPVATVKRNEDDSLTFTPLRDFYVVNGMELYAAPVRTKDLTDDEIETAKYCLPRYLAEITDEDLNDFARAVIAADREINK